MNPAFAFDAYLMKRQVFALTGTFRIFNPQGQLALFSRQKMFRLREDIRVFNDESQSQEILLIKARNIIDFSAAYDVVDPALNRKVGVLRRKGWSSVVRDQWELLDANDQPIGALYEDSVGRAMLRRLLLGALLPQDYDMSIGNTRVADLKQRFSLFGYVMDIDFRFDTGRLLDRRLGLAAAILLGTIEGKQHS